MAFLRRAQSLRTKRVALCGVSILALCASFDFAAADDVDITADTTMGVNLDNFTGATARVFPGVTVSNTGTIIPGPGGSFTGIFASSQAWTLTNQGTIDAQLGNAITFSAGGTVNNEGTIDTGFNGVRMSAGGTVNNLDGAVIDAGTSGIWISGVGIVTNAGSISGSATTVSLDGGGTVTNEAGGLIENLSQANAVAVLGGTSRSIINHGTIRDISGGFATGAVIQAGSVTNHAAGEIIGTYNAIWAISGGPSMILNEGMLTATAAGAIEMQAGGSVENSGTMTGMLGVEVFGGSTAITNSGSITGTGGTAIRFANGTNSLTLLPTSSISGSILGGTGMDSFILDGLDGTSGNFDFGANTVTSFNAGQKLGEGTWTLTGNAGTGLSGTFNIDEGRLNVNGTMTSADFEVAAGAVLGGTGTVGATTIGGTVAPGVSIGTLSTGSLVFDAGSTYEVEVASSGAGDLLDVTGTATINGGTVNVLALDPNTAYSDGQQWVIIDTTGGVSGSGGVGGTGFDALSDNSAFLDFSLSYDDPGTPMQVLLTLATVADFASTAETYNQMQAASGLQQLDQTPGSDALAVFNALSMLSAEESRAAYDAASGELHASAQHALLDISDLFLSTIARRQGLLAASGGGGSNVSPSAPLAYAGSPHEALALAGGDPAERLAAWLAPMGEAGEIDGDGNAAALDQHAIGVAAGIDWMDRWLDGRFVAGLAAGYTNAEADVAARLSSAEFDSGHAGAYAAWDNERLRLSGAAAYAFHAIDTRRRILFPGVDRTATGDFDGHTLGLHGEGAYRLPAGGLSIAPLATADALFGWRGSGTESGAGALDLAVDAEDIQRVTTGLGVALGHAWAAGPAHLVAELRLLWEHAFGDDTPAQDVTLAGAPGAPFNVHGPARAKDWLGLGAGLGIAISDTASLTARYDGALSPEGGVHQGHLSLGYRF